MFFIGVFGVESKEKIIKELNNLECKKCLHNLSGNLIKRYTYFHFFFIPIFKWNEEYFIICNNCSCLYRIAKEKGKNIELGKEENITYWDLNDEVYNHNENICNNCKIKVHSEYQYCPYCGNKLK